MTSLGLGPEALTALGVPGLDIASPQIEYALLLPVIIVFVGACVGIGVEAAAPRSARRPLQLVVAYVSIVSALLYTVLNWMTRAPAMTGVGALAVDGPTYLMWSLLLVFGGISIGLFAERTVHGGTSVFAAQAAAVPGTEAESHSVRAGVEHTEVFPLALFALSGMMIFPASNDLITMFVGLEVLSLPLYLLCGLARRRRLLSQEAALKYFLLGALSSAFFVYGAALLYGYAGSFELGALDAAIATSADRPGLLLAGMALIGVGLLFKFGAVPFHSWTPDVYAGAPTPVTAFMAVCTKIAAIGALLRVFYVGLGADRWDWQPLMTVIAIATMALGSVLAITQTDVKRMLAYSSIAHAGFIMTALVGASQGASGAPSGALTSVSSVMFYLVAYGAATIGAFAVVTMVRDAGGEATQLSSWVGLGRRSPVTAAVFSVFLLSFAGIPLTSGFIGKWAVFAAAWSGGAHWLVVVSVLISVVAAFFYVRVIVLMFFADAPAGAAGGAAAGDAGASELVRVGELTGAAGGAGGAGSHVGGAEAAAAPEVLVAVVPVSGATVVRPAAGTLVAVGVGVLATLGFGVFPGPLLALAQQASEFIR